MRKVAKKGRAPSMMYSARPPETDGRPRPRPLTISNGGEAGRFVTGLGRGFGALEHDYRVLGLRRDRSAASCSFPGLFSPFSYHDAASAPIWTGLIQGIPVNYPCFPSIPDSAHRPEGIQIGNNQLQSRASETLPAPSPRPSRSGYLRPSLPGPLTSPARHRQSL